MKYRLATRYNMQSLVKIKKLYEDVTVPTKGSEYAAGYDLYAYCPNDEITIMPHGMVKIKTGISTALPIGTFGAVFSRSGLATKQGLRIAQGTAVIDADYRGEWLVPLYNDSNEPQVVKHGDRIAQLVLIPFLDIAWNEVEELDSTERGEGGFGHSGK